MFHVSDIYQWGIGLSGKKIRVNDGGVYDFTFRIDEGKIYTYSAKGIDANLAMIELDSNAGIFNDIRRGRRLYIKIAGEFIAFNLDGTARALSSLLDCVRFKGKPIPASSARPQSDPSETTATAVPKDSEAPTVNAGSGFFVNSKGVGLTNAHVVDGCQSAVVSGYGPAIILARDVANDLALVKITGKAETDFVSLRRKPLQLGESVFAMGFPLAGQLDNGLNFTSGLVSSLAGLGNDTRALQFTAPIQLGNSGGPVVDGGGVLIGIIQSKLNEIASLKETGSIPQNINFAIKADLAGNFIRANSEELFELESRPTRDATLIAKEGRGYTFQIKCQPK